MILAAMALWTASAHASNPITNYKSGISLDLDGRDEVDYVFERWYGDPLIDDHGVVYLKSSTPIRFSHNARNRIHTGDPGLGVIRYKVDRDLSYGILWSLRHVNTQRYSYFLLPAYDKPLTFAELTYAPEHPDVPVLGSTGPVPGTRHIATVESYKQHWYRGFRDAAGDEWHTITVGDDDTAMMDKGLVKDAGSNMRLCGSDGKIHYFIVNPRTPALWFSADQPRAQWYTTPPKAYFVPRLHEQTTHLTTGVRIHLSNIMDDSPVWYRIGNGEFTRYTGPIDIDALADGEHKLECYYKQGQVRVRTLVKNPPFPSDRDRFADGTGHGYLLWADDAELNEIRRKLLDSPASPLRDLLRGRYAILRDNNTQWGNGSDWHAQNRGKGERLAFTHSTAPFTCALLARIEGIDKQPRLAQAARHMLLENDLLIDPVGRELDMNFMVIPSHRERVGLGYYNGKVTMALAHAYDLLIREYRAPAYPDGFTAIEDLKIRDILAADVLLTLHDRQGLLHHPGMGITAGARSIYAMIAAMAMPGYSTPYYGTSGFDGARAVGTGLPFPNQAATWKELFYLNNIKPQIYPDQTYGMNVLAQPLPFALPYLHGGETRPQTMDGNIRLDGISNYPLSSIAYNSFHQMGAAFAVYSNTLRLRPGHGLDLGYLDRYFEACFDSRQPPDKVHNQLTGYYPNPLVVNRRHPQVARKALEKVLADKGGLWRINGAATMAPYLVVWMTDELDGPAPSTRPVQ